MKVYRIARWANLEDLSGFGAEKYGGRWNAEGYSMLYTSINLSLAVLEILANTKRRLINEEYGYIEIEIPENVQIKTVKPISMPNFWRNASYSHDTISKGTDWIKSNSSLGLSVPSAVLSQERNILINPRHKDHQSLKITIKGKLNIDGRVTKSA
ncbi:MAG: RES domain-containing protein [Saprospiraceae bacterium]